MKDYLFKRGKFIFHEISEDDLAALLFFLFSTNKEEIENKFTSKEIYSYVADIINKFKQGE